MIKENTNVGFEDNYFTHNRKLKLEEYDDNGNVIDVIEFKQEDLWNFYQFKNNYYADLSLARKKDREYFKGKELELMKKMLNYLDVHYFSEETVKYVESIFKTYTIESIEFALHFKDYSHMGNDYNFSMQDYWKIKEMKFIEVLDWIKDTDGLYYAVSNDGAKGITYLEEPTKKQAKYQRQKNGKRIVFLSFVDWKEYEINENQLV